MPPKLHGCRDFSGYSPSKTYITTGNSEHSRSTLLSAMEFSVCFGARSLCEVSPAFLGHCGDLCGYPSCDSHRGSVARLTHDCFKRTALCFHSDVAVMLQHLLRDVGGGRCTESHALALSRITLLFRSELCGESVGAGSNVATLHALAESAEFVSRISWLRQTSRGLVRRRVTFAAAPSSDRSESGVPA